MDTRFIAILIVTLSACTNDADENPYDGLECEADDYDCMLRMESAECESESELVAEGVCHWEGEPQVSPLVCDDVDRFTAGVECFRSADRCQLWLNEIAESPTCDTALSTEGSMPLWRDECGWIGDAVVDDLGC